MRYLVKRIPSTSLVQYDGSRYYCEIAGGTAEKSTVDTTGLLAGSKYLDVQTGTWYVYDELTNAWAVSAEGGSADPAVVEAAVEAWLDAHPEATTTVQDGSISYAKLDTNLKGKADAVATLSDEIVGVSGIVNGKNIGFEKGNIVFGAAGFTYSASSQTIRTPENNELYLDIGDVIYLSDYTNMKMYIGWIMEHDGDIKYNYRSGWITDGKYEVMYKGNYKIVLRHNDNTIFSDTSEANNLIIEKINSSNGQIKLNKIHNIVSESAIKSIAHRGMNKIAPENTAPAFIYAKKNGFKYVETDVWPTADGNYVCMHDDTVNRTSNGTGTVYNMTLAELDALDFGAWFSINFTGTKILTFDAFIALCRNLGLHPYIELKHASTGFTAWTLEQVTELVNIVKKYGMLDNVTWIDYGNANLSLVLQVYDYARIGILTNDITTYDIASLNILKETATKEVFFDANYGQLTETGIGRAKNANVPVEVYSADNYIISANPYISGFTTNHFIASVVLYDGAI